MSNIEFRSSHDLFYLHNLVITIQPEWKFLHNSLFKLTAFAVAIRYPGLDSTNEQALLSVEHCRVVRKTIRPAIAVANQFSANKIRTKHVIVTDCTSQCEYNPFKEN